MRLLITLLVLLSSGALPASAAAQEVVPDTEYTYKARVLQVSSEEVRAIQGTGAATVHQVLRAQIVKGDRHGDVVTVENDYLALKAGDLFYLTHRIDSIEGTEYYMVTDPDRLPVLGLLAGLFLVVILVFGGRQGIRGLLSLIGSLFFIVFLLLPGILNGYPPVLVAVGVASLIIIVGSYVTHGFNRTTSTAVIGMVATVALTGVLAYVSVGAAHLTGFADEEAIYLNMNLRGGIDLAGLLIGGILIGMLGVMYDAAIGQSVAVEEIARAGRHLTRREVYARTLRIGREHVGALVNTLAIAYVGAALPLLLLFYGFGTDSIVMAMNREIFASEIVRTLVGSIGVVLVVPVTTAIAAWMLVGRAGQPDEASRHHLHHHHS